MDRDEVFQVKLARQLREFKENLPAVLEYERIKAMVIRERFNALLKSGFTEAQAIELCKGE